jgi:monovalent cation/hydrogen antiporter
VAGAEVLVFLLVAVALQAGLGLRFDVPYPVVLVVGGLVLGLVPGLPAPDLDPHVVFFAFLPPLLYAAAFQASAYELRANAAPIGLLAVGLVLITVVAVAAVAHWVIGVPWVAAFVLKEMRRDRAFPADLLRSLEAELDVDEARVRSRGR